jgi:hypothetical protein
MKRSSDMRVDGWLAIALALGLGSGQVAVALADEVPGAAAGVAVRIDDGRLTLQPHGAPLAEVLRAIGEAGGFEVILRGSLAEPVNEELADLPLEDAIRTLVGAHGLMVLRAAPSTDQTLGDIAEIRVRARGDASAQDLARSEPVQAAPQEDVVRQEEIDPAERQEAYRRAVRDYVPPTREQLTLALSAPATEDRIVAVPKVGMLPAGEAVKVLEDALSDDQDALVRSRAVAALTRLKGPAAGRLLRQRAIEDADADLRAQAINAIATSRGERSVNVLARAIRQDPDPEIRRVAVRALGRIEGDLARRHLERATREGDPEISRAAEQALAARADVRD